MDPRNRDNPTRSGETERQYLARFDQFVRRFSVQLPIDSPNTLPNASTPKDSQEAGSETDLISAGPQAIDLVNALIAQKASLRPHAFRYMRAVLRTSLPVRHSQDQSLGKALALLNSPSGKAKAKHVDKHTSTLKSKFVRDAQIAEVLIRIAKDSHCLPTEIQTTPLAKCRSTLSGCLLLSGMVLGLRPSEWGNAQVVQTAQGEHLQVLNGKNSNGRATGEFRWIPLDRTAWSNFLDRHSVDLTSSRGKAVLNHLSQWVESFRPVWSHWIDWVNQDKLSDLRCDGLFDSALDGDRISNLSVYEMRRRRIEAIQKWDRATRVALSFMSSPCSSYSGRHQFSANVHCLLQPLPIAELMGHASPETASESYAQARSGNQHFKEIRLAPEDPVPQKVRAALQKKLEQGSDSPFDLAALESMLNEGEVDPQYEDKPKGPSPKPK